MTTSGSEWEQDRLELERRLEMARQMGGKEGIARQHERGRLTVRERIGLLVDPDSFREFGALMGRGVYDESGLASFTPKARVDGMCTIEGRRVVVTGTDFTVRGGSAGSGGGLGMELPANERALAWRVPYVRLLDAAGGSVRSFEELGRTYLPDGNVWSTTDVALLDVVPVVSAVLGSVAGLPAVQACLAHWNVMVRGTSELFPGGPPVVKASLGYEISKEDLGGAQIHGRSGVIDNVAESEEEAFAMIRQFLSYLPSNVDEMPPLAASEPPAREESSLRTIVPDNARQPFSAHELIDAVVDTGSFFEMSPDYGASRVTGFARVAGYPVGVMANNSVVLGGSTDVAAGQKVIRHIERCDQFHLPLVSFADEPGFMVGLESEKEGIERAGARLVWATCRSRMPWITFVVRRLYGVGGQCHHRPTGMFRRYAWPSARWGSMHIAGGAAAAFRRDIEASEDPAAKEAEIEARLQALASPFLTAEATGQDIIDPVDTRALLAEFLEDAQRVLFTQLGSPSVPYRP